ncbi:transmembrane protein 179B-like [Myxocyprinus asiaticus]|uniref:transmembrane protein 179B-like n=1 Tax=Myxocyprinus asiaticus TaxID=70543 RepID=UPI002223B499|nr:transmembrane protein 179B-like [Myxocyprinus asiaticus]
MALPWLLLLELLLYCSSFICGIVTAASVTISQGNFAGKCVLYGSVRVHSSISVLSSSSPSLCYFVSAISACVAVFCLSLTFYWIYTICVDREVKREKLWMNITLGMCGVFLFFLLVTGCILKIGRDQLCQSVLHEMIMNITRCEEAQNKPWMSPINGNQFYSNLHSAETAVWVNLFFWMIIAVLVLAQRKQGSENGSGGDDPSATPSETEPFFNRPGGPQ